MPFVSPSDFNVIPYSIANIESAEETLLLVIDNVVPATLKRILGLTLYKQFVEGIEALPDAWNATIAYVLNDEAYYGVTVWRALQPIAPSATPPVEGLDWTKVRDDVWLKLRDGAEYIYPTADDRLYEYTGVKPFLIPVVYERWLRDYVFDTQTDAGVVASELENAGNNGTRDRQVNALNSAARLVGSKYDAKNTLWGYLFTTWETDYAALQFCSLPKITPFDF